MNAGHYKWPGKHIMLDGFPNVMHAIESRVHDFLPIEDYCRCISE